MTVSAPTVVPEHRSSGTAPAAEPPSNDHDDQDLEEVTDEH